MSALEDRRQNAREAYYDARYEIGEPGCMETAIETATRVRITPEMLDAMNPAVGNREDRLRAAFKAAGFEVVE